MFIAFACMFGMLALALLYAPVAHSQTTLKQCTAHWPRKGGTFAGEVRMVHDGDTACVCSGPDPRTCVRTRVADFYAVEIYEPGGPAARDALAAIVAGKWVICRHHHVTNTRSAAYCTIDGAPLGDLLRAAGIPEGGNGYKPPRP